MNAKRSSPSVKTYSVAGKTLAEIQKDISKKGPVDPNDGKRYAGSCLGKIAIGLTNTDLAFTITPGSSPVEAKATVSGGSITSSTTITVPKLTSDKDLSDAAQTEWQRFVGATNVHEYGHEASLYTLAVTIGEEIVGLSATGTGADEKAAKVAAGKALLAKISDAYGGTKLNGLINDEIKAYDSETNHGAKQGAVLKTSIT